MADHVGARIRYWRKRRGAMSQEALAGLAGVSQPYVSQIEAGLKGVERRSTLVAFARALQVSVADLLGQPGDPSDPAKADVAVAVPAIRVALVEIEEGARRQVQRGAEEMAAAVQHAADLRARSNYVPMAQLLPSLLTDAAAYGGLTLARIGYEASVCLRNLGYRDLALPAARIAVGGAEQVEHAAWLGATHFIHTLAMPIEAASTTSMIATRGLSDLQAKAADAEVRQMLGQLHLSASLSLAVEGRVGDADDHIVAAGVEADSLGDPQDGIGFNLSCFGPTNVQLWRMSVFAELGEYGKVIEIARQIHPQVLHVANRHQSYWLTYGRALAHSGRNDREALAAFMHAERAAPTPFSINPMARDAVLSMIYRARRREVPQDLRTIARRLGIEVGG
jgi:transcriptional regulator with XRE-family HTH domain